MANEDVLDIIAYEKLAKCSIEYPKIIDLNILPDIDDIYKETLKDCTPSDYNKKTTNSTKSKYIDKLREKYIDQIDDFIFQESIYMKLLVLRNKGLKLYI